MTTQTVRSPTEEACAAAVGVMKLLADGTRLRLLHVLGTDGEHSVTELADVVPATTAGVSQHLAKLRLGGLVLTRREGNRIYYRLANEHVGTLVAEALMQADHLVGGAAHHGGAQL